MSYEAVVAFTRVGPAARLPGLEVTGVLDRIQRERPEAACELRADQTFCQAYVHVVVRVL